MGPPLSPQTLLSFVLAIEPKFEQVLFCNGQRPPLSKRVRQAIEEDWPIYIPSDHKCRGRHWTREIPLKVKLYKPRSSNVKSLKKWRKRIRGTVAEVLDTTAEHSWKRFFKLSEVKRSPFLSPLKPLCDLMLVTEKEFSLRRVAGELVDEVARQKTLFEDKSLAYHLSSPRRMKALRHKKSLPETLLLLREMQVWLDFPFMYLGCFQACLDRWDGSAMTKPFDVRGLLQEASNTPKRGIIWKGWTDWAMSCTSPISSNNQRRWAEKMLKFGHSNQTRFDNVGPDRLGNKCIQVSRWRSGKERPSLKSVEEAWRAASANDEELRKRGRSEWLFYWGVVLLVEQYLEWVKSNYPKKPAPLNEGIKSFDRWKKYFSKKATNG